MIIAGDETVAHDLTDGCASATADATVGVEATSARRLKPD
jgi:hypothetical protein